eukprot:scaffold249_cov262-Chaetoceros_neogracile.AAC.5
MKFFKRNRSNQDESEEFTSSSEANRRFPNNQTDERENIGFVSPTNTNKTDNSYDIEHIQKKSNKPADEKNQTDEDYSLYIEGEPVYVVKQKRGYLSILFSVAQTIILVGMMIQCGVAPMRINPMVGPYPDALSYWGGKNSYNILYDGEYWRLFSPVMLHAGIFHLLCNVAVQLDTGAFFEREWGMFIWLFIYAGSAGSGSILSVIISPNSIGVGSSGAVCGLFGAKIAEALCRCREIVDWAAHVGGLIGGFMLGMMIFSLQIKTRRWKIGMFSVGLLSNLLFYGVGIGYMVKIAKQNVAEEMSDVCGYYEQFYEDYECNCMMDKNEDN